MMVCRRSLAKFLQGLGLAFAWALAFLLPLAPGAHAQNFSDLTFEQISEIAGLTSDKVTPIRRARLIAAQNGFELATYGETSRLLLRFIQKKMDAVGGLEKYKQWLNANETVHLFDWHKVNTNLDLLLFSNLKSTNKMGQNANPQELISQIQREYPGDVFYKKLDIQIADEFLNHPKFKPQVQHHETISNIPIGSRGIIEHEALKVTTPSGDISLPRSGVQQLRNKKFNFVVNPNLKAAEIPDYAFDQFNQVLRWIRYASEFPDFELSESSKKSIQTVVQELQTTHKQTILKFLRSGDSELRMRGRVAESQGGKIVEALEKIQIYSGDSNRTRKLLDDFGITQLANEAKVKAARIFDPLPPGTPSKTNLSGKTIRFKHRTSLASAQNMSNGALWISNGTMMVNGTRSQNDSGTGIYMVRKFGDPGYGTYYVEFDIHEEFVSESKDLFVASERTNFTNIGTLSHDSLVSEFLGQIKNPQVNSKEIQVLSKSIVDFLDPLSRAQDKVLFADLVAHFDRVNPHAKWVLAKNFAAAPGNGSAIATESGALVTDSKILKEMFGELPKQARYAVTVEVLRTIKDWKNREWQSVLEILTDADKLIKADIVRGIQAKPIWPDSFWQKVPELLMESDNSIRLAMGNVLSSQLQWPESFWQELPAILRDAAPDTTFSLGNFLKSQPFWPQSFMDEISEPGPDGKSLAQKLNLSEELEKRRTRPPLAPLKSFDCPLLHQKVAAKMKAL